ncbi:MAG: hypothetical protein AB1540_11925 [Bdellovibrionota bacterium]
MINLISITSFVLFTSAFQAWASEPQVAAPAVGDAGPSLFDEKNSGLLDASQIACIEDKTQKLSERIEDLELAIHLAYKDGESAFGQVQDTQFSHLKAQKERFKRFSLPFHRITAELYQVGYFEIAERLDKARRALSLGQKAVKGGEGILKVLDEVDELQARHENVDPNKADKKIKERAKWVTDLENLKATVKTLEESKNKVEAEMEEFEHEMRDKVQNLSKDAQPGTLGEAMPRDFLLFLKSDAYPGKIEDRIYLQGGKILLVTTAGNAKSGFPAGDLNAPTYSIASGLDLSEDAEPILEDINKIAPKVQAGTRTFGFFANSNELYHAINRYEAKAAEKIRQECQAETLAGTLSSSATQSSSAAVEADRAETATKSATVGLDLVEAGTATKDLSKTATAVTATVGEPQ